MQQLIFISFLLFNLFSSIKINLFKSDISKVLPNLKLHYTALISDKNDIYIFDLIPLKRIELNTIVKLLLFQNVPAQTRLRHFYNHSISEKQLIDIFNANIKENDDKRCRHISLTTLKNIKNKQLQQFISKNINVNTINLYTSNCQHFYRKMIYDH